MKELKTFLEHIMRSDRTRYRALSFFLYFFSLIYGLIIFLRRFLYRKGVFSSVRLPVYVISVGNITLGGSGKTPMAIYLAGILSEKGYRPAILSRGYKGLFEREGGIVSDGEKILSSAKEAGDEPYMMAVRTGVPVICGKNRAKSGQEAIRLGSDVIILDDGFQHLKIKRDLNLLLMDSERPFGNGHIIPRGMLRETRSSIRDADAFIMTRCKEHYPANRDEAAPVFFASHRQYVSKKADESIKGRKIMAVSGIADNEAFAESLRGKDYEVVGTLSYDDHHDYSSGDLEQILEKRNNLSADLIITTEKDYVKLSTLIKDDSLWEVIGVEHDFGTGRNEFDEWILSRLRQSMKIKLQDHI